MNPNIREDDPTFRQTIADPVPPNVYVDQTARPSGSSTGLIIAALVVVLGILFALSFDWSGTSTTPAVTDNSAPATSDPLAPAPATPPAAEAPPRQRPRLRPRRPHLQRPRHNSGSATSASSEVLLCGGLLCLWNRGFIGVARRTGALSAAYRVIDRCDESAGCGAATFALAAEAGPHTQVESIVGNLSASHPFDRYPTTKGDYPMNNFRNTVAVLALLCASGMAYAQESTPAAPAPEVQNKADVRRQAPCLKRIFLPSARLRQRFERPASTDPA